jgi:hypothetical protein
MLATPRLHQEIEKKNTISCSPPRLHQEIEKKNTGENSQWKVPVDATSNRAPFQGLSMRMQYDHGHSMGKL